MKIDHEHLYLAIIFALVGLGLFLVAIKLMSGSLKKMSGQGMTKMIKRIDKNRWIGLLFGFVFTTMIQSSDGSVALAIGLIGAGLISLRAVIPFLLGANVGTATTTVIVALGGSSTGWMGQMTDYFMLAVFIGAGVMLFAKMENKVNAAMLIFSIGAIFLGLKVMGTGMKAVTNEAFFKDIIKAVSVNEWLAMFSSMLLTGIIQSSSATTTIVQNLVEGGDLKLPVAIAMIIGANIGTTFTALITSIGGHRDARRIAIIWLTTNAAIAFLIMPFVSFSHYFADFIELLPNPGQTHASSVQWQISYSHLIFNTVLAGVFIWLIGPLEWWAKLIVRDKKSQFSYNISLPKELLNESPELAFQSAAKTAEELGKMTSDSLHLLYEYYKTKDSKTYGKYLELIALINITRDALYVYLVEIGARDISKKTADKHLSLVLASRSLERIPLLGNELAVSINSTLKKGAFDISDEDYLEMKAALKAAVTITDKSVQALTTENRSPKLEKEIIQLNELIDDLVSKYSANHIGRASKRNVTKFDFLMALKLVSRMSHHAFRVYNYTHNKSHEQDLKQVSKSLEKELLLDL